MTSFLLHAIQTMIETPQNLPFMLMNAFMAYPKMIATSWPLSLVATPRDFPLNEQ